MQLRTLFAVEPELESEASRRIDDALRTSRLARPDGVTTHWLAQSGHPGAVREQERDHVGWLIDS